MQQFFLYFLAYFMMFASINLGRVESEKFGLFTKEGLIQFLMIMGASIALEWACKM